MKTLHTKLTTLLATIALAVISTSAHATWTAWSPVVHVQATHSATTGNFYVYLDTSLVTNTNSCPNWEGVYYMSSDTSGGFTDAQKAIISSVLAAKAQGTDVRINSTGCSGYNLLDQIQY